MLGTELKSAVVTGGGGGIGSEIVRNLHASGIEVTVACLQTDRLDELAAELGVEVHSMDICDAEAVSSVFGGREIDIVVNCAAVLGPMSKLHETPVDIADRLVRVNLVGTLNFIRAMVPGMISRKPGAYRQLRISCGRLSNPR